jgi:spore germination cell wall hydrolase CwlJ-like protein
MVVESLDDLHRIASTVWELAGAESQHCQRAVAWVIVNRIGREGEGRTIADICDSVRREAEPKREKAVNGVADMAAFLATQERVAAVLARQTKDPTEGARHLHRHDASPAWSRTIEPSALIGAYFFYPGENFGGERTRCSKNFEN